MRSTLINTHIPSTLTLPLRLPLNPAIDCDTAFTFLPLILSRRFHISKIIRLDCIAQNDEFVNLGSTVVGDPVGVRGLGTMNGFVVSDGAARVELVASTQAEKVKS